MRDRLFVAAYVTLTVLAVYGGWATGQLLKHRNNDVVTVQADKGACTADYRGGAWHICDVTVPAPAEDTYAVSYRDGAWHLVLGGDQ